MAGTVVRIERSMEWMLGLEDLFFAVIVGYNLHRYGLHGALATAIAFAGGAVLLVAIIQVRVVFWLWTLWISGLVGYNVFSATREGTKDWLWGLFAGALAVIVIVALHLASRRDSMPNDDIRIIHD